MSRIGKRILTIPTGCDFKINPNNQIVVSGPKGKLNQQFSRFIKIELIDNNQIKTSRSKDVKHHKQLHGTTNAIINNMLIGVTHGWTKELEIHGVGYRAAVKGRNLILQLGFSHLIEYHIPQGIDIEVKHNTQLKITGPDKHQVGQVASQIKVYRPVEPYKGKGIRYKNEIVRRKEVKSAVKTA